jgi:hypothetical protein
MAFAAGAGSYGKLWVLNGIFNENLGLRLTMAKQNPRDKRASFHKYGSNLVV